MKFPLRGRARRFGAGINTDYIIASRRKRETLDPQRLREYLFEEIRPGFAATIAPGDFIVADANFGCGSAMEVAVTALQGAGIAALLAPSFARTYYRNAVNNGLLPLVCDTSGIADEDPLEIVETAAGLWVHGPATRVAAQPLPAIMRAILAAGGLVPYLRASGDWEQVPD